MPGKSFFYQLRSSQSPLDRLKNHPQKASYREGIETFLSPICRQNQSINKDDVAQEVADEIEKTLQKKCFDQRPIASVIAQEERNKILESTKLHCIFALWLLS